MKNLKELEQKEEDKKREKRKALKRSNGQGTVYKISDRRRRPWVAKITIGWESGINKNGKEKLKQKFQTIGYFEEKSEARDALDKHRLSLVEPAEQKSTMTLKQVYDACFKSKLNSDLSKSTKDGIKASWKKLSKLENRLFCEIRSDEFQDIVDECRDVEKASESSLTKLKSFIYALCDYAYHNSIIKTNYSTLIKIGKVEANEREAFTDLEVETFKKNVDTIPWVDTILVLCYTGMRPTEMLTLTKFNVDIEKKVIVGGIKTDAGKNRPVPIHPLIYPIFVKYYNKNGETIFCDDSRKKISTRTYREKKFAVALETLKIRALTPYSCRHTFATMLNRVNAPSANIQKLIGHVVGSDTTDKVYTHPEIEDLRKTIEMLK